MSTQFNKDFDKLFNLPSTLEENKDLLPVENVERELSPLEKQLPIDLFEDYNKSRDNITAVMDKGMLALDDLLAIARESEKAHAFEAVSNMMKTLLDASNTLIDNQNKIHKMTNTKPEKQTSTTNIKQAVFVGTTADLLKARKEKQLSQEGDIIE